MATRRTLIRLVAGSAASATLARPAILNAQNQVLSFKWGASFDKSHPTMVRVGEALDRIRQDSGGQIDIKLFPNGQLGADSELLSQVRSGALQFYTTAGIGISGLVPGADISDMPFAFKSYKDIWAAMDGELGAHVVKLVSRARLHAFSRFFNLGYRTVTSSARAVLNPDDLKGLKIRVPPSKMLIAMFKALGAAPAVMNVGETFTALQTGLIDGQDNPLSQTASFKFDEVQRYCALTRHSWTGLIHLANGAMWDGLPGSARELVDKHLTAAALAQREDIMKLDASLRETLQKKGMQFSEPDIEAFRATLKKANFYDEIRKTYGNEAWSLVEKYAGALA